MSTGDLRRSHSATFFSTFRKEGDSTNQSNKQRPLKWFRQDETNPTIIVSNPSTTTLVPDDVNTEQNFLQSPHFGEKRKEQLALKLNRLKNKHARCESHKQFL